MIFSVLAFLGRFILTVVYGLLGLWLAFPISYFFQDALYDQISWAEYVSGGLSSVFLAAQFGSFDVFRWTAITCAIAVILLGKFVEWRLKNRNT